MPRNHSRRSRAGPRSPRGFNEAEARASESPVRVEKVESPETGFNEAEARASESHVHVVLPPGRSNASMRPRRVPRNHMDFNNSGHASLPGFNEAEARASESLISPLPGIWNSNASMRPRRVPRNHRKPKRNPDWRKAASMRPRRVPRNHAKGERFKLYGSARFNEAEARASESRVATKREQAALVWLQ